MSDLVGRRRFLGSVVGVAAAATMSRGEASLQDMDLTEAEAHFLQESMKRGDARPKIKVKPCQEFLDMVQWRDATTDDISVPAPDAKIVLDDGRILWITKWLVNGEFSYDCDGTAHVLCPDGYEKTLEELCSSYDVVSLECECYVERSDGSLADYLSPQPLDIMVPHGKVMILDGRRLWLQSWTAVVEVGERTEVSFRANIERAKK